MVLGGGGGELVVLVVVGGGGGELVVELVVAGGVHVCWVRGPSGETKVPLAMPCWHSSSVNV